MQIRAVAFDLGNTLVEYYERHAFPSILSESIRNAYDVLSSFAAIPLERAQTIALTENAEHPDGKVRPLQERFDRIFGLKEKTPDVDRERASRAFLQPIFKRARKYHDSEPTLRMLRQRGYKLAIVSNTPWGSPSYLWREELQRLDLADIIDVSIFCMDVGWRKPAPDIFQRLLQTLNVDSRECILVGDEPVWDVEGAVAAGMPAILIDRINKHSSFSGMRIQNLEQIDLALKHASSKEAG
jgi:putative hydrolase of the HAD superfamily